MDRLGAGAALVSVGSSTGTTCPADAKSLKAAADGDTASSSPDSPPAAGELHPGEEDEASLADSCDSVGRGADDDAVRGDNEGDTEADDTGAEEDELHPEEDKGEGDEDAEDVVKDVEYAEEEYEYEPADAAADASATTTSSSKPLMITIGTRQYKASAFVKNRGFSYVPGKLKSNPKATFEPCTTNAPHSILDCQKLHLSNRGVLVRDRFIRLNMLVDNPGKQALLHHPGRSLKMRICRRDVEPQKGETHNPATCSDLHLLPDIVFVGIPGLRTAYFEAELRHNLAFRKLKEEAWETQCGTWCRGMRSHVVTTCRFLHYNRGNNYTEKPTPPHRPLAAIPDLTPSRPPQATDSNRRGRGRGHGGRGVRGRGNYRGRGRGSRGAAAISLPAAFESGHVVPSQDSVPQVSSITTRASGAAIRVKPPHDALAETDWMTDTRDEGSPIDYRILSVLFVLLGVFVFLLSVALRRKSDLASTAP
ncbi:conserved hypothetical protein [Leishmania mexicana MHOM/GT/2001/U1103]|uniref:Uncharacterized protein n=1 Tax=Leishmania mexicana (strain MHOM/GT/2001/U1103) TaxID=929439 RepID=E9ALZ4_LEIMU|nr:conserved hypothetical protein [Leishmania mexicana MHOM/GT/2001/U1103]CBZ23949.1 conserved hypothetical protein [Leishmania mexicana MHOM/GT/2001/U1103]